MDRLTRLGKAQLATFGSIVIANCFTFIALLTPAWQVAEDTDARQYVQSGLWMYCPGSQQCWYIFSDDVVNYYEKACLILLLIGFAFCALALVAIIVQYLKQHLAKIGTIFLDIAIFLGFLCITIALTVFVINAEMLESRYLIGIQNTFEKQYGYSFYLTCVGVLFLLMGGLGALLITTFVFFSTDGDASRVARLSKSDPQIQMQTKQMYAQPSNYNMMKEVPHFSYDPSIVDDQSEVDFNDSVMSNSIRPEECSIGQSFTVPNTTRTYFSY